ncbi:unnamed protein product [Mycena citricolor]|uniref:Uncharacterized protein n=1 Tax=Mycena citricolor TaxID=2018698 RepID=A0AAD2H4R4_9AGAR|nr:unnamed protein product [Mycena citricolor]
MEPILSPMWPWAACGGCVRPAHLAATVDVEGPSAACGRCIRPAHLAATVDVGGPSVMRRGRPLPGHELEGLWNRY